MYEKIILEKNHATMLYKFKILVTFMLYVNEVIYHNNIGLL